MLLPLSLLFAALPTMIAAASLAPRAPHQLTIFCENDARVVFHEDKARKITGGKDWTIGRPDSARDGLTGGIKLGDNTKVFDLTPEFGSDLDARPLFFTVLSNAGYPDQKKHTVSFCLIGRIR